MSHRGKFQPVVECQNCGADADIKSVGNKKIEYVCKECGAKLTLDHVANSDIVAAEEYLRERESGIWASRKRSQDSCKRYLLQL